MRPGRGRRLWWLLTGPVLAVAVTVASAALVFDDVTWGTAVGLVDVELAALVGLPLAWRRRSPEIVLAVVALALCGIAVRREELGLDVFAAALALTALARRTGRRWVVAAGSLLAALAMGLVVLTEQGRDGGADDFLWVPLVAAGAVLVGAILRESDRRGGGVAVRRGLRRPTRTQAVLLAAGAAVAVPWHLAVDRSLFGPTSLDDVRWVHEVGSGSISAAAATGDGDVLVLAQVGDGAVLARYGDDGRERWQRRLVDAVAEFDGGELAALDDGGAAVLVMQRDPIATGLETDVNTGLLIRVDEQGETVWEELLSGPVTALFDVAGGSDAIVVAGQRPNVDDPSAKPGFVEVFGLDGSRRWDATVTGDGSSAATAAAVSEDGSVYVGGAVNDGDDANAFLRRYDAAGSLLEDDRVDVGKADIVADLATSGRTFVVTVISSASSFSDPGRITSTVRATTPDGELRWSRRIEGRGRTVEAVAIAEDGSVVVAGNEPDFLVGSWLALDVDLGIRRIRADGEELQAHVVGSDRTDLLRPAGLALTGDGDLVLVHDVVGGDDPLPSKVVRVRRSWPPFAGRAAGTPD